MVLDIENVEEKKVKPNPITERRYGRFWISHNSLKREYEAVQKVFAKVIVVRCEYVFAADVLEYTAASWLFDKNEENVSPPFYDIIVNNLEEEEVTFSVQKRK